ncbi:hypothetical protein CR513_02025, partial [Mucuna pruriens]
KLEFPSLTYYKTKKKNLDLVHFDICDPIRTRTLGGNAYFMLFIDIHSIKTFVYILRGETLSIIEHVLYLSPYVSLQHEVSKKLWLASVHIPKDEKFMLDAKSKTLCYDF